MAECRAVRTGFSAAFKRPAVFAAELSWRWAFAFATWLLIIYGVLLFLSSIPVSDADMFGLSGILPGSVAPTIAHILTGSGPKMVRVAFVLLLGVSLLSWIAYSLGRAAVLRALITGQSQRNLSAVFRLNLLRTFGSTLTILAYAGCAFLVFSSGVPDDQKRPFSGRHDFSLLYAALAFGVAWLWSKLEGRLALASVFALRGQSIIDAIASATEVSLRRIRQFAWVGLVFGAIRFMLWVGVFFGALIGFSMFAQFSGILAWLAVLAVVAVYSAVSNFFSVGALAAQVRVIEWDEDERRILAR